MRKNYIIKDARRILAEQIRDNGMNTMNKNYHQCYGVICDYSKR